MIRTARPSVVIAGAGGFIGTALARELHADCRIIGLGRGDRPDGFPPDSEWRRCDLFSLFECERAVAGAGSAFYLVHSMLPSARLTQGTFQDFDLICADNFARAAARAGIGHIIYLGGMIPDQADLSRHILSRREVELTLGAHGVPLTTLRAGIVIGLRGSSYGMFRTVLERAPIIPCPRWSASLIQPVALADAIRLLRHCLENPETESCSHDIGSADIMTYRELLEHSARLLGRRRLFFNLPFQLIGVSKVFLALISGYPRQLVSPLVESLKHSLFSCDLSLQIKAGLTPLTLEQAVRASLQEERSSGRFRSIHALETRRKRVIPRSGRNTVRSVQRIHLPPGRSARWLALRFTIWLPRFFRSLLRADVDSDGGLVIRSRPFRISLLELRFDSQRSVASVRQLFYITGGLLARRTDCATRRPRLEFREVLGGSAVLVAIHDYRPTLPWPVYNLTQARAHLWVMRSFARAVSAGAAKFPN